MVRPLPRNISYLAGLRLSHYNPHIANLIIVKVLYTLVDVSHLAGDRYLDILIELS